MTNIEINEQEHTWNKHSKKLSVADSFYLSDLGITEIIVDYSGGGDSGQIDGIGYINPKLKDYSNLKIPDNILMNVESLAYQLLNGIGDWYNNAGGYGTIKILVPSFEYTIDANYYQEPESVYNEETGEYDTDYDNQEEWSEGYSGELKLKL